MRSLITEVPDRELSVENIRIDYYAKLPLSTLLTLLLSIPWIPVVFSGSIPYPASLILVSVTSFVNLLISTIIVYQWLGGPIDKIARNVYR